MVAAGRAFEVYRHVQKLRKRISLPAVRVCTGLCRRNARDKRVARVI